MARLRDLWASKRSRHMQTDTDPVALRDLARLVVDAWNRGDARAFASLFTPAAEYVTGAGERLRGRQAISNLVARASPAAQVTMVDEPLAECDAGLGRLGFAWSAPEPNGVPRRGSITCACVRHEGGWLIESLRNEEAGAVGETRGGPSRS